MADYSKIPSTATLDIKPFKAHVSEEKLQQLKDLIKLSPIGPAVFENTANERRYGMTRDWLINAKKEWETSFDWRKQEDRINSFPNFTTSITDDHGTEYDIHFLALFSKNKDAIPLAFFHGWPGSFLEFLDLVDLLRNKYTPSTLPYHIIVPSLPGYAYSSGPPMDRDYSVPEASEVLHKLLVGLGFTSYLVQGGDIGSRVSRVLAEKYDECKGMHLNLIGMPTPSNADELHIDELEKKGLQNKANFFNTGCAYAIMHGQRTATIGLALSSSPIALLSWIGEKFLAWTDTDPSVTQILESVTLYWLTDTFPRCIYPYRSNGAGDTKPRMTQIKLFGDNANPGFVDKPCGYSFFLHDVFPMPRSWAATMCNLVAFGQHESGGHFAAMEKPAELLKDVEEWVEKAWRQ